MKNKAQMKVYIMSLDYFYDDYKRPEGSSDIVGVTKNESKAYLEVFKIEYKRNIDTIYEDIDEEDEEDQEEDQKEDQKEDYKKEIKSSEYTKLYKQLELKEFTKEFISSWETARENFLGESEYGVMSTGYRASVTEHELIE